MKKRGFWEVIFLVFVFIALFAYSLGSYVNWGELLYALVAAVFAYILTAIVT